MLVHLHQQCICKSSDIAIRFQILIFMLIKPIAVVVLFKRFQKARRFLFYNSHNYFFSKMRFTTGETNKIESKAIMNAIPHDLSHTKGKRSVNPTFIETNVKEITNVVIRLMLVANFISK